MPHIDLKFITRNLTEEQQQAIADDFTEVLKKHFDSKDEAVSIRLNEIDKDSWKTEVYEPVIKAHLDKLVKKPGYTMD